MHILTFSTDLLSSNKTRDRGFTHRLQVFLILKDLSLLKNPMPAEDFISEELCDLAKPFYFDDGSQLSFKLDAS